MLILIYSPSEFIFVGFWGYHRNLTSSAMNTYLDYTRTGVLDMANNTLVPPASAVLAPRVRNFTRDSSSPVLQGFSFDSDAGVLSLVFDETVDSTRTFDITGLTVVSQQNASAMASVELVELRSGMSLLADDTLVRIQLDREDQNASRYVLYWLAMRVASSLP